MADRLVVTLTVDVPYLIAARLAALFPSLGCVLAHVANYGMVAQHGAQPSQARSGNRENVEPYGDSLGHGSAGDRLQRDGYLRTVG